MTRHGPCRAAVRPRAVWLRAALRRTGPFLLLGLLAACASTSRPITMPVSEEAADYRSHARSYYAPPGSPGDPWGPYIVEAAKRFDVPEIWIRSVMQQESGGHEFINGQFVTSVPGAMGLMQLMPPTYDDMRAQYSLGSDPFEPHDNIIAGTAYLRQMYDIYGSPGFLAAYNTGPGRLDDFLTRNRALPHETRQYVSIIGPQIAGVYPSSRSPADLMVTNHQSGGVQYAAIQTASETRAVQTAWARRRDRSSDGDQPVQVAEAPVIMPAAALATAASSYPKSWSPVVRRPTAVAVASAATPDASVRSVWAARLAASPPPAPAPYAPPPEPIQVARAEPAVVPRRAVARSSSGRFRFIEPAMAASAPMVRGGASAAHDWAIQVGAFGTVGQASHAAGEARSRVHVLMPSARTEIAGVRSGAGLHVYRARLTGLSREDAVEACQRIERGRSECMVVSPDSRS